MLGGGGGAVNPNDAVDGLTSTTVQTYGELNVEAHPTRCAIVTCLCFSYAEV